MIHIMIRNKKLAAEIATELKREQIACALFDPSSIASIDCLYNPALQGAVVDSSMASMPEKAWIDLLSVLSKKVPVVVLTGLKGKVSTPGFRAESLNYVESPQVSSIVEQLSAMGAMADRDNALQSPSTSIPLFNTQFALQLLKNRGSLSVITVNATSFRQIAMDHGFEAYQQLQDCFHNILKSMSGTPGAFRRTDMLIRRNVHSNTYYIFLEQSRQAQSVPAPGVLESMADRIALRLQKEFWDEIFKKRAERSLPDCINLAPIISVGYATALYNPCVDAYETVEHLLDSSIEVSKVQVRRIKDRASELMHTLIQTKDLLYPNYQAVFHLPGLTKSMVDESKTTQSIAPMQPLLYGFESLIRVRPQIVQMSVSGDHLVYMDLRMLRPDILFALSHQCKVALELDQVCLQNGVAYAVNLPGKLMVNILPRNLLHIERLLHLIAARSDITFEVSESEGVSNNTLMDRVRDYVASIGCSIAADDFGKGYANIERVLKMKPEVIKLDRSLVENIHKDPSKRSFVEGIVKAAKLGKSMVLAEGIELWEEAEVVQSMGVDLIQGFLCHRPESLEQIMKQLSLAEDNSELIDNLGSVA